MFDDGEERIFFSFFFFLSFVFERERERERENDGMRKKEQWAGRQTDKKTNEQTNR